MRALPAGRNFLLAAGLEQVLDYLATLRFTADEPIARITAPLREAQLVESRVMNLLHYETLAASKAARCVLAAGERGAHRRLRGGHAHEHLRRRALLRLRLQAAGVRRRAAPQAIRGQGHLPGALRSLDAAKPPYPVTVAEGLSRLAAQLDARN